jgi:CheY-like chemotaxis protein
MSGVQLAEATHQSQPDLPVLFMTGYSGASQAGMPAVDARVLRKPYRPDALRLRVAELLHDPSLQGSKR